MAHAPLDPVGLHTLEAFADAPGFNRWMYSRISPFVGERILEVGAGIGNLTVNLNAQRIIATDASPQYVDALRKRFQDSSRYRVGLYDLMDTEAETFADENVDTVVCLNVLEHVADENVALQNMRRILRGRGRLVVLVPYSQLLYCEYDRGLGHVKRYSRRAIKSAMQRNGFVVQRTFLFNLFGGLGWLVTGKLLGKSELDPASVRRFERMLPLFKAVERFGTPFGASVICVGTPR